ncbi:MAG: hypothetical protein WA672_03185, partial [Candidatus Angelobacter sp.]
GLDMASSPRNMNAAAVLVERAKACLRNLDLDPWEFHAAIDALEEQELKSFGYDYFYFNLLSVFGATREVAEIRRLAAECNRTKLRSGWAACRYILDLKRGACPLVPRLRNWNTKMLEEALAKGRGLLLCATHFGAFRSITSDLLAMGFSLNVGLDSGSSANMKGLSELAGEAQQDNGRAAATLRVGKGVFRVVDVEQNRLGTTMLLAALKRNEIVLLFIDGNTGIDGNRGKSNRADLSFLSHRCLVKAGAANLALLSGASMMHVVALNGSGPQVPEVALQHLFKTASFSSDNKREQRASAITREIYQQLESFILRYPEQWESACLLHRWRAPETQPMEFPTPNTDEVSLMLEQAGPVGLKPERVARVDTGSGPMLVDVSNLRVFQIGTGLEPVLQKLCDSEFSYGYFQQVARDRKKEVATLLSRLCSLQWIAPATRGQPPPSVGG